eukprot:761592-Hanusia_phi.AAC.1
MRGRWRPPVGPGAGPGRGPPQVRVPGPYRPGEPRGTAAGGSEALRDSAWVTPARHCVHGPPGRI